MRSYADWDTETWASLRELIDDAWGRDEHDLTALALLVDKLGCDIGRLVVRGNYLLSWDLKTAVDGMADIRHSALRTFCQRALKETEGDRGGIESVGQALRELAVLFAKKRNGQIRPDVTAAKAYHVSQGMMLDVIKTSALDWAGE